MGESCLPATYAGRSITLARIICSPVVITYRVAAMTNMSSSMSIDPLIDWLTDWLIDCRTPFLCVQGSADVLCNPSGSKLLYRYSTRECTGTEVQGGVQVQFGSRKYAGTVQYSTVHGSANSSGSKLLHRYNKRECTDTVQYKEVYRYSTRKCTGKVQGSVHCTGTLNMSVQLQYKVAYRYSTKGEFR